MTRPVLPLAFGAVLVWVSTAAGQDLGPGLSADALGIACAPRATFEAPNTAIALSGSLTDARGLYAPWHRLVVNSGSEEGLKTNQVYYVRRLVAPREMLRKGEKLARAVMTSGWIHIDEVQTHRAIASVVHACGAMEPGDYLEPFAVPVVPTPLPPGTPDYTEPGRVLFAPERGTVAGTGTMVAIDRGSGQGVRPGQRVTFYRPTTAGPNVIVARGIAVLVQPDTSTVKVVEMRDAVETGDFVAPHK